ncbi:unnamed protein product, partial [Ectocarpus sp. 12 AP-2014]
TRCTTTPDTVSYGVSWLRRKSMFLPSYCSGGVSFVFRSARSSAGAKFPSSLPPQLVGTSRDSKCFSFSLRFCTPLHPRRHLPFVADLFPPLLPLCCSRSGFDPHDDSDFLTIHDNEVYNNGYH